MVRKTPSFCNTFVFDAGQRANRVISGANDTVCAIANSFEVYVSGIDIEIAFVPDLHACKRPRLHTQPENDCKYTKLVGYLSHVGLFRCIKQPIPFNFICINCVRAITSKFAVNFEKVTGVPVAAAMVTSYSY